MIDLMKFYLMELIETVRNFHEMVPFIIAHLKRSTFSKGRSSAKAKFPAGHFVCFRKVVSFIFRLKESQSGRLSGIINILKITGNNAICSSILCTFEKTVLLINNR